MITSCLVNQKAYEHVFLNPVLIHSLPEKPFTYVTKELTPLESGITNAAKAVNHRQCQPFGDSYAFFKPSLINRLASSQTLPQLAATSVVSTRNPKQATHKSHLSIEGMATA